MCKFQLSIVDIRFATTRFPPDVHFPKGAFTMKEIRQKRDDHHKISCHSALKQDREVRFFAQWSQKIALLNIFANETPSRIGDLLA